MGGIISRPFMKKNLNIASPNQANISINERKENYLADLPSGCEKDLSLFLKENLFDQAKWDKCAQLLLSEGFGDEERIEDVKGDNHQIKIKEILDKSIQILKIRLIENILKEHEKGISSVKDKDIVFFLGQTGSGKSTTILYLLGGKMEMRNGSIDCIDRHKRPDLSEIKPNNQFRSGTKFLNVGGFKSTKDFTKVCDSKSKYTNYLIPPLLCDSPGYGDSDGNETEIANKMAILRAIKSCNSLKIVALIRKSNMGLRGEGIKKLCEELSNIFNDFKEMLKHLIILLPEFATKEELRHQMNNFHQIVEADEPDNKNLIELINKILNTIEEPHFKFLNPVDKSPSFFLRKIMDTEPFPAILIKDEKRKLINSDMPMKFADMFEKYLDVKAKSIPYLVREKNYDMLDYILQDLETLLTYSELRKYASKIQEIRRNTFDFVRKGIDDACHELKDLEFDQDVLKEDDPKITNFVQFVEKLSSLEKKSQFKNSNICCIKKEILINSFTKKLQKLKNRISTLDCKDDMFVVICKNVQMLKKKVGLDLKWFEVLASSIEKQISDYEKNKGIEIGLLEDEALFQEIEVKKEEVQQYGEYMLKVSSKYNKEINQRIDKFADLTILNNLLTQKVIDPKAIIELITKKLKFIELCNEHLGLEQFGIKIKVNNEVLSQIKKSLISFSEKYYEKVLSMIQINDKTFDIVDDGLTQTEGYLMVMRSFMDQEEHLKEIYIKILEELKEVIKELQDFIIIKLTKDFGIFKDKISKMYELINKIDFQDEDIKMILNGINLRIENQILEDFSLIDDFDFIKYDQSTLTKFIQLHQIIAGKKKLMDMIGIENQFISNYDLDKETRKKLFEEMEIFINKIPSFVKNMDIKTIKEYYDFLGLFAKPDILNEYIRSEAGDLLSKLNGFIHDLNHYLQSHISKIVDSLMNKEITHSMLLRNGDPNMHFTILKLCFEKLKALEETFPEVIGADLALESLLYNLLNTIQNIQNLDEKSVVFLKYQEFDVFFPKGSHPFLETLNILHIEPDERNFHQFLIDKNFVEIQNVFSEINKNIGVSQTQITKDLISRLQTALIEGLDNIYQTLEHEMSGLHFTMNPDSNLDLIKNPNEKLGFLVQAQAVLLVNSKNCRITKEIVKEIELSVEKFHRIKELLWNAFDEFMGQIDHLLKEFDLALSSTLFQNMKYLDQEFFKGLEDKLSPNQAQIRLASCTKIKEVCDRRLEKKLKELITFYETCNIFSDEFKTKPPKAILEKMKVLPDPIHVKKMTEVLKKQIDKKVQDMEGGEMNILESQILILESLADLIPEDLMKYARDCMRSLKERKKKNLDKKVDEFKKKIKKIENTQVFAKYLFDNLQEHKNLEQILIDFIRKKILEFIASMNQKQGNSNIIKEIEKFCVVFENLLVLKEEIQKELEKLKDHFKKKFQGFINEVRQFFEVHIPSIRDSIQDLKDKFKDFLQWNEHFKNSENQESIIWQGFNEIVDSLVQVFQQNLERNNEKFKQILEIDDNFWQKLSDILQITANLEPLLTYLASNNQFKNSSLAVKNIETYLFENRVKEVKLKLDKFLNNVISTDLFKLRFEQEKREFFIKIKQHKQNWVFFTKNIPKMRDYEKKLDEAIEKMIEVVKNEIYKLKLLEKKYDEINEISQFVQLYCENYLERNQTFHHFNWLASIKKELNSHLEKLKEKTRVILPESTQDETIIEALIEIKNIAINIPTLKAKANKIIDDLLAEFSKKRANQGGNALVAFVDKLKHQESGQIIINEHAIFKDLLIYLYNLKVPRKSFEQIKDFIEGDHLNQDNKKELESNFQIFEKKYQELNKIFLLKEENELVSVFGDFCDSNSIKKLDYLAIKQLIPELLAYVFSLYTIMKAKFYRDAQEKDRKSSFLFQPHNAQIVSILRIFGCDNTQPKFENNLIQIGTGEGKSITIATVSIIFALIGYEVKCACYSQNLCDRDYDAFKNLFEKLQVSEQIQYGTFNQLCETVLNNKGNIRDLLLNKILRNQSPIRQNANAKHKILIIDEVDVFFSPQYYGQLYIPFVKLCDESISKFIDYIWEKQDDNNALNSIRDTNVYKKCKGVFKNGYETLLDQAISKLRFDLMNYKGHQYVVSENKIGYKEHDNISYNLYLGYKTLFAYLLELNEGRLTESEDLKKAKSLLFSCGQFSYGELAKENFPLICGVTGTLKTLNEVIKKELADNYGINKYTYAPSVYNKNQLSYEEDSNDIKIVNQIQYFSEISNEIQKRRETKSIGVFRPVIVVFETTAKLMDYYKHITFSQFKKDSQFLTEEIDKDSKRQIIERATKRGQVTLIESSFGRGTDFILRDEEVMNQGGSHILQTFFSKEVSEEIQIKGRTARQGDKGSYSLVLLNTDLEYFGVSLEQISSQPVKTIWKEMKQKREEISKKLFESNQIFVTTAKTKHDSSKIFLEEINKPNAADIKILQFLKQENRGGNAEKQYKTLILMDGTGSMGNLLQISLDVVYKMFERAVKIMTNKGYGAESLVLQFAIYRNYNCDEDEILEKSTWENSPEKLRNFLQNGRATGGWGNEAIEIGFNYANEIENLAQIILIGDSRANERDEVFKKRKDMRGKGEKYWANSKYSKPTFYRDELEKIQQKKIKIHAFYVKSTTEEQLQLAKENFNEIAQATEGNCEFLDLNDIQKGSEQLTNLVTIEILRIIDESLAVDYENAYGHVG